MNDIYTFYPQGHEKHYEKGHPERPERVEIIKSTLNAVGWWGGSTQLDPLVPEDNLLFTVHSQEYVQRLTSTCLGGGRLDADTYTTTASLDLARNAVGGAVAVADAVWDANIGRENKVSKKGFALTRPPGHHAESHRGMGFCLLNNVAVAAEYLLQEKGANRIAIVDLDLHHGNGTQEIFWERNDVFYISTHQYPLYPGTGRIDDIGSGDGLGYTANFPLPPATGDVGFMAFMQQFILPIIDRYQPEIVLVSYGFDPHWMDPLGHLQLSAEGYGTLIRSLSRWADQNCLGRIALFLEGGYDLDAASACSLSVFAALMDETWVDEIGQSPRVEGSSWKSVARLAAEIWID